MIFFEMEFYSNGFSVYATHPYDNMDAVLEEVLTNRDLILESIGEFTGTIAFDSHYADTPWNRSSAEWFDYWLSCLALQGFENADIDDGKNGVTVQCRRREVRNRFVPPVPVQEVRKDERLYGGCIAGDTLKRGRQAYPRQRFSEVISKFRR